MIRVLVADTQLLFADALAAALRRAPDVVVLEQHPTDGDSTISAAAELAPDVAVVDLWLDFSRGAPLLQELRSSSPGLPILVTAWLYGPAHVRQVLATGAVGFLPKSWPVSAFDRAIRLAANGEDLVLGEELAGNLQLITDKGRRSLSLETRVASLTPREIELLRLLADGASVKEVANRLAITQATARTHIHSILSKIGVRSQLEAVGVARGLGVVP